MAKEQPTSATASAAKKAERKAAKAAASAKTDPSASTKRSDSDGVHKAAASPTKKPKKEKKQDRAKSKTPGGVSGDGVAAQAEAKVRETERLIEELDGEEEEDEGGLKIENGHGEGVGGGKKLIGALVPFARPLAEEKVGRRVLKGVRRANKHKTLKRGVKEVVKALRKSPTSSSSGNNTQSPHSVVVLAADISPMDVISHIPVLCEDHGVPYIFVESRAELGAASATKRPTSVVMVGREKRRGGGAGKKKEEKKMEGEDEEEEEEEDWGGVYADLVKVVVKAGREVRI